MSVLAIDQATVERIDAAIAQARQKVMPLSMTRETGRPFIGKTDIRLADRPPDYKRPIPSVCVEIPVGYMACISFEMQPAGLCRHLSVSIDKPGKVPTREVCLALAVLFGFRKANTDCVAWLEEFEPGEFAINMVQPVSTDA